MNQKFQKLKISSLATLGTPNSPESRVKFPPRANKLSLQPKKKAREIIFSPIEKKNFPILNISKYDGLEQISKNLSIIENFYTEMTIREYKTEIFTNTKTRIYKGFQNLKNKYKGELDLRLTGFTSLQLILKILRSEKYSLELGHGDIEFIFWTCFFISIKFTQVYHSTSLKEFASLVDVRRSLIRNTEIYILADLLKFEIADIWL